jgi:phosphate/sulfate permease
VVDPVGVTIWVLLGAIGWYIRAWVLTIPCAALLGALTHTALRLFGAR